jgi:hypothetical protein
MAKATSVSLSKFTAVVQDAVKAAVQKHPKFKMEAPNQVAISYLIRGIPVPDALVANLSLSETQAFAADIASRIANTPGMGLEAATKPEGIVYSHGRHIILGFPVPPEVLLEK